MASRSLETKSVGKEFMTGVSGGTVLFTNSDGNLISFTIATRLGPTSTPSRAVMKSQLDERKLSALSNIGILPF